MNKILNDYSAELAIVNANFCSTYYPSEIYNFSLESLRIAICNRIKNGNIIKMAQRDIDILVDFIMSINDTKMYIYREALIKWSEVLHYEV